MNNKTSSTYTIRTWTRSILMTVVVSLKRWNDRCWDRNTLLVILIWLIVPMPCVTLRKPLYLIYTRSRRPRIMMIMLMLLMNDNSHSHVYDGWYWIELDDSIDRAVFCDDNDDLQAFKISTTSEIRVVLLPIAHSSSNWSVINEEYVSSLSYINPSLMSTKPRWTTHPFPQNRNTITLFVFSPYQTNVLRYFPWGFSFNGLFSA